MKIFWYIFWGINNIQKIFYAYITYHNNKPKILCTLSWMRLSSCAHNDIIRIQMTIANESLSKQSETTELRHEIIFPPSCPPFSFNESIKWEENFSAAFKSSREVLNFTQNRFLTNLLRRSSLEHRQCLTQYETWSLGSIAFTFFA